MTLSPHPPGPCRASTSCPTTSQVGREFDPVEIPMEVCKFLPGQVKRDLTSEQKVEMIKETCAPPNVRYDSSLKRPSTLSDDTAPSACLGPPGLGPLLPAPRSAARAPWRLAAASGARLWPTQSRGLPTFHHQVRDAQADRAGIATSRAAARQLNRPLASAGRSAPRLSAPPRARRSCRRTTRSAAPLAYRRTPRGSSR